MEITTFIQPSQTVSILHNTNSPQLQWQKRLRFLPHRVSKCIDGSFFCKYWGLESSASKETGFLLQTVQWDKPKHIEFYIPLSLSPSSSPSAANYIIKMLQFLWFPPFHVWVPSVARKWIYWKQELKSYISLYEYKALKKDIKGFFAWKLLYKEKELYGALFCPLRKSIELKLDLYQVILPWQTHSCFPCLVSQEGVKTMTPKWDSVFHVMSCMGVLISSW